MWYLGCLGWRVLYERTSETCILAADGEWRAEARGETLPLALCRAVLRL